MSALQVLCFFLLINHVISWNEIEEEAILANKVFSNLQILQSVLATANTTLVSMENIHDNLIKTTNSLMQKNNEEVTLRVAALKRNFTSISNGKTNKAIIKQCIEEEDPIDVLTNSISDEIKRCISLSLAENVNIISSSIAEAQTFMDLPKKISEDLQICGDSRQCMMKISIDAVNESLEIPSKILIVSARIQQVAYHALTSVNVCALNGLIYVVEQGMALLEDITVCVEQRVEN